jgi:PAS domain S-box-containing protein
MIRSAVNTVSFTGVPPALSQTSELAPNRGVWSIPRVVRLALKVVAVGVVCHFSTQVGFALKFPPHYISPLWPTGAILFSVLVVAPVRHWWAYVLAAYFTSVLRDAQSGFPSASILFVVAGVCEILVAATLVRRFAAGVHAFETLRNLVCYTLIAVVMAPLLSAFIVATLGGPNDYWFYWRVWFLSESLAYLVLAPAMLTWTCLANRGWVNASASRALEACVLGAALLSICIGIFLSPVTSAVSAPALVYLPLPLLLWAAVRFGPVGVNTALLIVAAFSVTGAVYGRGPFVAHAPAGNVLALQLFLAMISLPLMFLAALIAERHARANILQESEERFRTMADTAPVMVWMSGPDKLCTFFNQPWLDFTGQSLEHELGNGWFTGVYQDDLAQCLKTFVEAFDARRPFVMDYRLRRHDGEFRWVSDHGVPRFDAEGAFLGYIGSCTDITDRRQAELDVQQKRNELTHLSRVAMLGELSASLAHELNQPLTAILSNAQAAQRFLQRKPADLEQVQAILKDIVEDDDRAGEVIRRLRLLFKKGEVQWQELDINDVIRDVIRLMHSDLVNQGVTVEAELDPAPFKAMGDRVQLQQVLLNLMINGCDAMAQAETKDRTLTLRTESANSEGVRISIIDRGCGITPTQMDRLFEPFYTTKTKGLGLGLSVCRTIVSAHGGTISASNNPDGGASFHVNLPALRGDQS